MGQIVSFSASMKRKNDLWEMNEKGLQFESYSEATHFSLQVTASQEHSSEQLLDVCTGRNKLHTDIMKQDLIYILK